MAVDTLALNVALGTGVTEHLEAFFLQERSAKEAVTLYHDSTVWTYLFRGQGPTCWFLDKSSRPVYSPMMYYFLPRVCRSASRVHVFDPVSRFNKLPFSEQPNW